MKEFIVNIGPNLAKKCNLDWNFRGINCGNKINYIETKVGEITRLYNNTFCIESPHILGMRVMLSPRLFS